MRAADSTRSAAERNHPKLLPGSTQHPARVYHLRFDRWGWALISVCDAVGMIGIASDWGNWSFNWSPKHIGGDQSDPMNFTRFLASHENAHYVAGKMLGRDEEHAYDDNATLNGFREIVLRDRREKKIDKDEARRRWDAIGSYCDGPHRLDELASEIEIDDFWGEDHVKHSPTATYHVFVECLWPAFQQVLRAELSGKEAVA